MNNFIAFQISRLERIRNMSFAEFNLKLKNKLDYLFSFRNNIRRIAFYLDKFSIHLFEDKYKERSEVGPINLEVKIQRQAKGGDFEQPLIVLINRACASLLGESKNVLEVGSGTGLFAYTVGQDPNKQITASEFDDGARKWAETNRSANNIIYCKYPLSNFVTDQFDVVVAIEVIEHLEDYASFLEEIGIVASSAIITTPNKNRNPFDSIANTPAYNEHVREWTSGEFYWVLRSFYDQVNLYTVPELNQQIKNFNLDSSYIPYISECGILTKEHILIAQCQKPKRQANSYAMSSTTKSRGL